MSSLASLERGFRFFTKARLYPSRSGLDLEWENGMSYEHMFLGGSPPRFAAGKVVCIGKNYRIKLSDPLNLPEEYPVLFMKPSCALVPLERQIKIPDYSPCYYEVELAALIGLKLHSANRQEAKNGIIGYAVALDLTLKELLDELKRNGRPWELAKSFNRSCPISPFVRPDQIDDPKDTMIELTINGEVRQKATTKLMIRDTFELVSLISKYFTLFPGDVVLTGTPAGGAILSPKANLTLKMDDRYRFKTSVM